jgi:hypothetical protein
VKFISVLSIFCLDCFNELTFPDSQDWLSVMEVASSRQGGNRRETWDGEGMCVFVCVCVKGSKLFRSSL